MVGAGGHAQEVAWSLAEHERGRGAPCELAFFDDAVPPGPLPSGLGSVVGTLDAVADHADRRSTLLVLGVGLPHLKARLVARLSGCGVAWATVVHPRAVIGPNVTIGPGSYVAAGAIVTVNVRLGSFVTVNMHAQVAHDGVVGTYATLHPNAHVAGRDDRRRRRARDERNRAAGARGRRLGGRRCRRGRDRVARSRPHLRRRAGRSDDTTDRRPGRLTAAPVPDFQ